MIALQEIAAAAAKLTPADKERTLRFLMRKLQRVLVAYSGGVDSSYLAKVATEELGPNATCVIGLSPSVSKFQRESAVRIAKANGFNILMLDTDELADPRYAANQGDRCYFCKSELYSKLSEVADGQKAVILDGTNADDLSGHRPGRVAAAEHGVHSPLAELGFTKEDIRELSKTSGLETWDQPASPCLSSRVAVGVPVTLERLSRIERAEAILRDMGFREFRVRVHGELARVEISPAELPTALDAAVAERIARGLKESGFKFVTLDLEGFRSGSVSVSSDTVKN
ncbi:MAG: ATP-dependent sacrificial sulfur transferase LarE [Acidobacteria bacterium ACB1]|nr:Pyridinium-3,5-biscarboxylic acid mononucleotide sulfurtransferase [Pyrinomonadaceae bacterium]MCE7962099.1 ATP-dependent sacrificial sulfur transferase LarE [Acidobacteria bacterium ACB1]RIJ94651.1 MAG: ATP-dependent sacrificial sulfur transferase LarE [Acidobacteriota bacterium]